MCDKSVDTLLDSAIKKLHHELYNRLAVISALITICKDIQIDDEDFAVVVKNADQSCREILKMLEKE